MRDLPVIIMEKADITFYPAQVDQFKCAY